MIGQDEHLLLDPSIRDWVVLPMVLLLVFVGMGRHYVQVLMKSDAQPVVGKKIEGSDAVDLGEVRHKQTVMRAARLRNNGNYVNDAAFRARKSLLIAKETGLLREKVPGAQNPMMNNPTALVDMMKGNLTFMLPNIAMMTFVSYFFSGFVCLRIPFSLPSNRFKVMMQRGVDLATLDVSYVSSLSWYFLVTFGMNGVYSLLLGEESEIDDSKMMQMQMMQGGMMGGGKQPMFDANAAYRFERDMVAICKHEFIGNSVEKTLLGERYPQRDAPEIDLSNLSN